MMTSMPDVLALVLYPLLLLPTLTIAYQQYRIEQWPGFALCLMVALLVCWLLVVRIGVIRWNRRFRKGLCPHCGYDMRGSPDECPECGDPRLNGTTREFAGWMLGNLPQRPPREARSPRQ
jgi:hypothetical protein